MADINVTQLTAQVQNNCNISDANYAGIYSLCHLLFRLRDLYKWENGLPPWQEPEPAHLMEWVDIRERQWEENAQLEFQPITIGDAAYEPFDMTEINRRLRPLGLVYGAGYVGGMKPSFFLAELVESQTLGELLLDVVDRELARDLFITPAMRQGNQIFARRSAMAFLLWDQIMELRPSVKESLAYALTQHGLAVDAIRRAPGELGPELLRVAGLELETWVYHEVGEVREDVFQGHVWHEIVSTYSNTPIELFARVIKDILADTHREGMLAHIIAHRRKSSLGFYVTFIRPFARTLFPEVIEAFKHFKHDSDWTLIEQVRQSGYAMAHQHALALLDLHEAGRGRGFDWARDEIISRLIEPLGILCSSQSQSVSAGT